MRRRCDCLSDSLKTGRRTRSRNTLLQAAGPFQKKKKNLSSITELADIWLLLFPPFIKDRHADNYQFRSAVLRLLHSVYPAPGFMPIHGGDNETCVENDFHHGGGLMASAVTTDSRIKKKKKTEPPLLLIKRVVSGSAKRRWLPLITLEYCSACGSNVCHRCRRKPATLWGLQREEAEVRISPEDLDPLQSMLQSSTTKVNNN